MSEQSRNEISGQQNPLKMRTFLPRIIFVLLLICTYTFADYYDISTPEECKRPCKSGSPPKTCYYQFTIEYYTTVGLACLQNDTLSECIQADGVETGLTTINRQLPGPAIEVCQYDRVIIDVKNQAEGLDVTIHWHGIFQNGYQYYDGVPFVTQCPIIGGNTFRYMFAVNNPGTHMYHSHVSVQTILGQYGSLTVRQSEKEDVHARLYDIDVHMIMISDMMYTNVVPGRLPGFVYNNTGQAADQILINGRGVKQDLLKNNMANLQNTTTLIVTPGTRNRFRLANIMSTVCLAEFSIEKHRFLIIAQDGSDIEPEYADQIVLASGERVDFVVHANQDPMDYNIMVRGLTECEERGMFQIGTLRYVGATRRASPVPVNNTQITTGVTYNPVDVSDCGKSDKKLCVSQLKSATEGDPAILSSEVDYRFLIIFGFEITTNLSREFPPDRFDSFFVPPSIEAYSSTINNVSYSPPPSPAISQPEELEQPYNQCDNYCEGFNYYHVRLGRIVEYFLFDQNNFTILIHPFHLHGYDFYVLDEGLLETLPPTKQEMKEKIGIHQNRLRSGGYGSAFPSKKDTIKVPAGGYVIIRFIADNPGWWLFHCHFLWHTVSGMDLVMHVGSQRDLPSIPPNFPTCGNFEPKPYFPV